GVFFQRQSETAIRTGIDNQSLFSGLGGAEGGFAQREILACNLEGHLSFGGWFAVGQQDDSFWSGTLFAAGVWSLGRDGGLVELTCFWLFRSLYHHFEYFSRL